MSQSTFIAGPKCTCVMCWSPGEDYSESIPSSSTWRIERPYELNHRRVARRFDSSSQKRTEKSTSRRRRCVICGTINSKKHSLLSIPDNEKIRAKWFRNIGIKNDDLKNKRGDNVLFLCDIHFANEDFLVLRNGSCRKLRKGAVPFKASANTNKNQASWFIEINDDEASDDEVCFVSSCIPKNVLHVKIEDDDDEDESPKITLSQQPVQNTEAVHSITETQNTADEISINQLTSSKFVETVIPEQIVHEDKEGESAKKPNLRVTSFSETIVIDNASYRSTVSSSRDETPTLVIIDDEEYEKPNSKDPASHKPPQSSKAGFVSGAKTVFGDETCNQSNISSFNTVLVAVPTSQDMTHEGSENSNSLRNMVEYLLKRVNRLEEEKNEMNKKLTNHQNLLNDLINKRDR
ncbi:uncharacterized protein LOC135831828 [Planococcus citri]|uniref:uncharacterized protein LOC135831828 n=1 Tax=Planococcus citri TaxID=170843 RepID=UPI0031F93F13